MPGQTVHPESSAGLRIAPAVLHGEGERFRVHLGTMGFYVIDHEESADDGTPGVVAGCLASKYQARQACDRLNEGVR